MDTKTKNSIIRRLAIAGGHIKKVKKMVSEEAYCLDIIHQSQAIQAALKKIDGIVLHGHLHSCVLRDVHQPKGKREKLIQELLEIFSKKSK